MDIFGISGFHVPWICNHSPENMHVKSNVVNKWETGIWGWLGVRRSAIYNHWACWQYGYTGGTWVWLGVERWQLCLQDTSRSANRHQPSAVGHWVSLCIVGCLIVYHLGILSLSCSQYSQTICWNGWDDNACLGARNTSSIWAWQRLVLTNKCIKN